MLTNLSGISKTDVTASWLWRILAKFWTNLEPVLYHPHVFGFFFLLLMPDLVNLLQPVPQWDHEDMIRCLSPPQTICRTVCRNVNCGAFSRCWRISLLAESHYLHKARSSEVVIQIPTFPYPKWSYEWQTCRSDIISNIIETASQRARPR